MKRAVAWSTVPVTRFQVRSQQAQGGVTVRLLADDAQSVCIRFFDGEGIDIDEGLQRKIERLFHREDFRRSFAAEIGSWPIWARTIPVDLDGGRTTAATGIGLTTQTARAMPTTGEQLMNGC